ncbi:MAG: hypothetical protein M3R51_08760 [Candidatus Eremiobacteraeota bacterium]|nr:hypothetical protein [Candidatus Eremiobacteraeota bacterium]
MISSSGTKKPKIHSAAYVASTATVSGDVTIGAGSAVLHGAVVTAEGASVTIGSDTVVMENAVIRGSGGSALAFPAHIGDRCIVGPQAYISGATIRDGAFIGSGAKIYNGIEVAANGRVAPNETRLPRGDFFETVFNLTPSADAGAEAARSYARFLRKAHAQDAVLADHAHPQAPPKRRSASEEPPQQQMTEVEGVVDAMMLELQEMEARRIEMMKKKPKK